MPKLQLIKEEIEEIKKLKDIAEIMAALAAVNLKTLENAVIRVPRMAEICGATEDLRPVQKDGTKTPPVPVFSTSWHAFHRLRNVFEGEYPLCHVSAHQSDVPAGIGIFVGSDMGFCGRLNSAMKGVAEQASAKRTAGSEVIVIGKQLRGGAIDSPIPFPHDIFSGETHHEPARLLRVLREMVARDLLRNIGQDCSETTLSIHYQARTKSTKNGGIVLLRCDIDVRGIGPSAAQIDDGRYAHRFLDLYTETASDPTDPMMFIFDKDLASVRAAYGRLKRQWVETAIVSVLVENLLAENFLRSSAMESAKDEAVHQIAIMNKRYAKERQARVTSELIELITSFTSLNEAA